MKNDFDFQRDVLDRSKIVPVLVDFWAAWCEPCRLLAPVLESLAAKSGGRWELVKVDTEVHPEVAARYGVRGIPNVKLFVDGAVIDEFTGALSEYQTELWLKTVLPSPWAAAIEQAAHSIRSGSLVEARELLEQILVKEPDNPRVKAMLVRLLLFTRPEDALRLAESLEGEAAYVDLCEAVRALGRLLARPVSELPDAPVMAAYAAAVERLADEDFGGALEGFISVLRENRSYDDDGSRKACIAIFRFLGEEHEVTRKYRRSFDRAF